MLISLVCYGVAPDPKWELIPIEPGTFQDAFMGVLAFQDFKKFRREYKGSLFAYPEIKNANPKIWNRYVQCQKRR